MWCPNKVVDKEYYLGFYLPTRQSDSNDISVVDC